MEAHQKKNLFPVHRGIELFIFYEDSLLVSGSDSSPWDMSVSPWPSMVLKAKSSVSLVCSSVSFFTSVVSSVQVLYTVPSSRFVRKNTPRISNAMKKRQAIRWSLYAGIITSGKLAVVIRMVSWYAAGGERNHEDRTR